MIYVFAAHSCQVSCHTISAVRGTVLMRASRIYIVSSVVYKGIGMVTRALEHKPGERCRARGQSLDLPGTDHLLWYSQWITRGSIASGDGSISKQKNGKERHKVLMTMAGLCWRNTDLRQQKHAWLKPSVENTDKWWSGGGIDILYWNSISVPIWWDAQMDPVILNSGYTLRPSQCWSLKGTGVYKHLTLQPMIRCKLNLFYFGDHAHLMTILWVKFQFQDSLLKITC